MSGFRGGPTFPGMFIGAAGGIALSHLPGLPMVAGAAMGIGAMTCAMLGLPLSSVLITTIFLGSDGFAVMPVVIVAVVVAYVGRAYFSPRPRVAPRPAPEVAPPAAPAVESSPSATCMGRPPGPFPLRVTPRFAINLVAQSPACARPCKWRRGLTADPPTGRSRHMSRAKEERVALRAQTTELLSNLGPNAEAVAGSPRVRGCEGGPGQWHRMCGGALRQRRHGVGSTHRAHQRQRRSGHHIRTALVDSAR